MISPFEILGFLMEKLCFRRKNLHQKSQNYGTPTHNIYFLKKLAKIKTIISMLELKQKEKVK